ncbi:MAG: hypothetical protein ACLR23_00305 [Clostridia bacterium]
MPPLPEAPPEDAVEGMLMGKPDCHFAAACGIGKIPDGYKVLPTVLWLESETGFSTPWLMNRPILNTLSDYEVMPGQLLTLYGRNLCAGDEYIREKYLVLFQNRDTEQRYPAEVLGTAEQVLGDEKPYCLHIKVPDPLPAGQYSLSVNLLNCGQFGYSDRYRWRWWKNGPFCPPCRGWISMPIASQNGILILWRPSICGGSLWPTESIATGQCCKRRSTMPP